MSLKSIICISVFLVQLIGFGQEKDTERYSLAQCIQLALENNLNLKSTALRANTSLINHRQAKASILPSLNGNYNIGVNNGRSIDPFTNDFINQELTFSNARLNLDATIFNGLRILNTIKQQRYTRQASEMEIEEAKQSLILNVTLAYLQILNQTDALMLATDRLTATNKQLKQQEDLYNEEFGNPADFADIKGQQTIDETNILIAESSLNNAKLSLAQLLNIDTDIAIDKASILFDFKEYTHSTEDVFKDAMQNLATFKAQELRVKAAKKGIQVAKAQYIPEISFFGQINTNYSSVAETFTETGSEIVPTGDFVTVNNEQFSIFTDQTQFKGESIEYLDQFENNLNTVVGIAVNIPLFNGFRAKNNVALEKIKVEESLIELERTAQQVKNAIDQVHFDMQTAYARYQSLSNQVVAFEESYRVNEIRFNNGVSKYLLRVKVLEFYRGVSF